MLIRDTNGVYRHKVMHDLGPDATAYDVLDYLLGDHDGYRGVDFVIKEWRSDNRKWWQRLNMFWAMPLTILIMPFQYIAQGQTGWSTKTAFGRWILRITGNLEDA